MYTRLPSFSRLLFAAVLIAALSGCDRTILTGRVTNAMGERLPGVAVRTTDDGQEALSDARGHYSLRRPPGPCELRFSKSGYAPAEVSVQVGSERNRAPEIAMWALPRNKGVYLYEEGIFRETSYAEPRAYLLEGAGAQQALRRPSAIASANPDAFIICYHMPRYEARLARLEEAKAALRTGQEYALTVLTGAGAAPVSLEPLDQPEAMLLRVRFDDPLEPGLYGLHWGALDGETALDSRVYLFEIIAAAEEAAATLPPAEGR